MEQLEFERNVVKKEKKWMMPKKDSISIDEFLSSISETRYNTTIVVIFSPPSGSKIILETPYGK